LPVVQITPPPGSAADYRGDPVAVVGLQGCSSRPDVAAVARDGPLLLPGPLALIVIIVTVYRVDRTQSLDRSRNDSQ
jgi:hypothetical protein